MIADCHGDCVTTGAAAAANTFRFDGAGDVDYYSALYINGEFLDSKEYTAPKIVNRVGSGDCFMAGLIYGFYNDMSPQQTLEFATAAAFEKLFIESDTINKGAEEILAKLD